jgi:hypothetical protein
MCLRTNDYHGYTEQSSNTTVLEQRFSVFCLPRHVLITIEYIPVQQDTVALGARFGEYIVDTVVFLKTKQFSSFQVSAVM